MPSNRPTLAAGLALAAHAVGPAADGLPAADDPLRLDLPALGPAAGGAPDPATLRVLASLYLAAELEQAGVVPIAELLAEQRDTLALQSYEAAARLDDFATRERGWYDRAARAALFARLFGLGAAATNDGGTLVNREFASLLASLCRALALFAAAPTPGASAALPEADAEEAAQALLANLAPRGLGGTLLAARRIADQVRHAVDVLRDPAICALVGARTLQETVVAILGRDAPDVQRLIDAGLAGQRVLVWLADATPAAVDPASRAPLVSFGAPIATTAADWLHAVGLDQPQQAAA